MGKVFMSCFGNENADPEAGECDECGSKIDVDGDSIESCCYSPKVCDKCGYRPCDDSC